MLHVRRTGTGTRGRTGGASARIGALAVLLTAVGCGPATSDDTGKGTAVQAIDAFISSQSIDKSDAKWKTQLEKPPQVEFEADKQYVWALETNKGPMEIRLRPDVAPMHVSSTIYLTRLGFYDDVVFHRVIPGFMAQGGDPTGTGRGGPGYKYDGELSQSVKHDKRGVLSMAHAGPGTDGSQFFLTFGPTPHLDMRHTVFGELTSGEDTLTKLEQAGSARGTPKETLKITRATIRVE